jgi:alanine racemase
MKDIKDIVKSIILEIRNGVMFDSHFVIDKIIREHSDDYLRFVSSHLASAEETEFAHSQLAKIISSFEGTLVEQQGAKSHSYNIRGNTSECALWLRISA